jgi:hypothetical protein
VEEREREREKRDFVKLGDLCYLYMECCFGSFYHLPLLVVEEKPQLPLIYLRKYET